MNVWSEIGERRENFSLDPGSRGAQASLENINASRLPRFTLTFVLKEKRLELKRRILCD